MKFFLDTANIEDIKTAAAMGMLDGVTTNPSLIAKEKGSQQDVLKAICEITDGPVNGEVIATNFDGMMEEAHALREIADNIVVKIPMLKDGMKAVAALHKEDIPTNVTLIFSPAQALLAAKAGASYVSPFIGRLDDIGSTGMDLIETIGDIFDNYGYETEILVASVRGPMHVVDAALAGADICTLPLKVLDQLFKHPLTDIGLEKFLADHAKSQK